MKKILLSLTALVATSAFASQPLRRYVTLTTADGASASVTRCGTDAFSWWEDAAGRPYAYDATRQRLAPISAAEMSRQLAAATDHQAHGPRRGMNASTEDGLGAYGQSGMGMVKSLGAPTIPVLMVAFSDKDFLPANDAVKIDRFLNEEGYSDEKYAVGSVADYFRHNSYGAFAPRFEVVAKVTLPNDYKYYGAKYGSAADSRRMEVVKDAVRIAEEQGSDFSKYARDGHAPLISILYAGPGEQEDYGADYSDYLWAHFSQSVVAAKTTTFDSYLMTNETMRDFADASGTTVTDEYMTGIGTFCHEFGHALGLPDMYDVNGKTGGVGETPGYWDVMDYQFMYDGYRPMEYSAYERSMMGWVEVEDLVMGAPERTYTVSPLADLSEGRKAYRIVNPSAPNEYVLLENRQKSAFCESAILGSGMLAWYVNYSSSSWASNSVNTTAAAQRVHVIAADGEWQTNQDVNKRDDDNKRYTFAGDPFPGYAGVTTLDKSLYAPLGTWFEEDVRSIAVDEDASITFTFGTLPTRVGASPSLQEDEAHDWLYDVQGRRMSGSAGKGIYISNNKLFINP